MLEIITIEGDGTMPTYDYVCDECGHEFEAYESILAQPRTDCPDCGRPQLRRKIGPGAAILFKGSGFYQTDYRSESYRKAAKADQSPNGTTKSSSDSASPSATSPPSTEPAKAASTGSPSEP
jgi:putative FmdB family regulatory protein